MINFAFHQQALNQELRNKILNNIPEEDLFHIYKSLGDDVLQFENKSILLTGASGFLGKLFQSFFLYLNSKVLKSPCRVTCLDNRSYWSGQYCPKFENFSYVTHDLSFPLTDIFMHERFDFIINACGNASPLRYEKFPLETMRVSTLGTENILSFAGITNVKAVLNFSSSEVYGTPPIEHVPTKETYVGQIETMAPRSCYDVGKLAVETLSYIYNKYHGVNVKIVRPFNVVGYTENDGRVIPNMVANVLSGKKILIYGDGKQTRTFCWFSDFLAGSLKVLLHGGNTPYNIGNQDNEITMFELGKLVEKVSGSTNIVELVPAPKVYLKEPLRRCPDISKAKFELGYNPSISLDESLSKFYTWAKNNTK